MKIGPNGYTIRGQWVHMRNYDPCAIPFGVGVKPEQHWLRIESAGTNVTQIQAAASEAGPWRDIYPPYQQPRVRVEVGARRRERTEWFKNHAAFELDLFLVNTDRDRSACRGLVGRVHYLPPRLGGLILAARFSDPDLREDMEQQWWRAKRHQYGAHLSEASGGCEGIVGCAILERLTHGNPDGRRAIAAEEGSRDWFIRQKGQPDERKSVIQAYDLAWISRVAVDRAFHSTGIGRVLCDVALTVAATCLFPAARWVELMRKLSSPKFKRLLGHDGVDRSYDFLTGHDPDLDADLPYTIWDPFAEPDVNVSRTLRVQYDIPSGQWLRSRRPASTLSGEEKTLSTITWPIIMPLPVPSKQRADAMAKRLFVPLSSTPYVWFRSGDKRWELRRYGRQYTDSQVRPGRSVELRRGYTDPKTSLWGTIESVQRAESLRDFFDKVPYAEVIPDAASVDDAVDQAARILGVDTEEPVNLIGFKLELDHVHDPVEA